MRIKVGISEGSKYVLITIDFGDFVGLLGVSLNDSIRKFKSKRRFNNIIGGFVISFGLVGKRDFRFRYSIGKLSSSLGVKSIGSLFGDEDESKELSVV